MQLEVGAILDGKVTSLTNFGAFVSLPDSNRTGMVHISEVAPTYVKEIKDFLKEGQEVRVKIIGISDEGKISLSIKQAVPAAEKSHQPRQAAQKNNRPSANVWQGTKSSASDNMSFEDMMAKFKQVSDEKMTDLKRSAEGKYGSSYSRRGAANK